ncbi:hypothetical protein [Microbacterium sp. E-13]|uniref:hypothetical protein n=1 Tax=Microbacterium sp. E-13 TaxID=3404048 RepID=UPI003CF85130
MSRTYVDNDAFIFATDIAIDGGYRTTIAVQWSAFAFEASPAHLTAIDRFLTPRPEVAEAWFVFPKDVGSAFSALSNLDEFKNRAMHLTLVHFRLFEVDSRGEWHEVQVGQPPRGHEPLPLSPEILQHVRADGMRQIFRDSESLSPASAGYHYERPGRGHSEVFMRTSQSVARAQHAYFIAICMLVVMMPTPNSRLYADTGGIIPLLHAVKDLWGRLDPLATGVSVDTFGGYEGYARNLRVVPDRDWVVISSSSSGSLAREVISAGYAAVDRVVTVFYLSWARPDADDGAVLCNLSNLDEPFVESVRDARLRPHASYRVSEDEYCEFCEQGSHPIELVGDSFFPAPTNLKLRMPSLLDRPFRGRRARTKEEITQFDHQEYFEDLYGLDAIIGPGSASTSSSSSNTTLQYGVSTRLSHLLTGDQPRSPRFRTRIITTIDRIVGMREIASAVVGLADAESQALAAFAARHLWGDSAIKAGPEVWRASGAPDSLSMNEALREVPSGGLVLVVAGVIGSGRALLSVNRELRILPDTVKTAYFVGVAHPESDNAMSIFKNSLGVRSSGATSDFEICWTLPRDPRGPGSRNSWTAELEALELVDAWLARYGYREEMRAVRARTSSLQKLGEDQLFAAPDFDERNRRGVQVINPKFALWPFEWSKHQLSIQDGVTPTQAEVYATIAHLLYESRRSNPSLTTHAHGVRRHGFAINPAIFDRLNDPQLQSAILRAAEPGELDYHADADASRAAVEVLKHVLDNVERQGGQAAYEFLVSITRGLQDRRSSGLQIQSGMLAEGLRLACARPGGITSFPPLCRALLYYITDTRPPSEEL